MFNLSQFMIELLFVLAILDLMFILLAHHIIHFLSTPLALLEHLILLFFGLALPLIFQVDQAWSLVELIIHHLLLIILTDRLHLALNIFELLIVLVTPPIFFIPILLDLYLDPSIRMLLQQHIQISLFAPIQNVLFQLDLVSSPLLLLGRRRIELIPF